MIVHGLAIARKSHLSFKTCSSSRRSLNPKKPRVFYHSSNFIQSFKMEKVYIEHKFHCQQQLVAVVLCKLSDNYGDDDSFLAVRKSPR